MNVCGSASMLRLIDTGIFLLGGGHETMRAVLPECEVAPL